MAAILHAPAPHLDGGQQVLVVDDDHMKRLQNGVEKQGVRFQEVVKDAREGDKEANVDLGVYHAFKLHWKAALWSIAISTCLVMEGYDLVIINSFYGQPDFKARFGTLIPGTNEKEITAPWQSGLSNSALCGEIIGLAINGWASERFGFRRTLMAALTLMTFSIFVPVFATSLPVFSFGEVLQGIPWGMFQTLTTAFAVEICPQTLRHYLTTYVCFCWGLGIFLSSVVVRATLQIEGSQWSWRLPFVLQWVWPIPLLIVSYLVPESPWWLVRKGRYEQAKVSVRRLAPEGMDSDRQVDQQVALMIHTSSLEEAETQGASYLECFRGINLRRTVIVCIVWAFQWLCGNPFMNFAVVFFQRAGLDPAMSLNFNIIMNTTYMIGTVASWKLMDHFGRKTLYTAGGAILCVILAVIGGLGFGNGSNVSWAIGSLLIVFALAYNCTIGPVCYAIVAEIPSGRLRAKSIVLARLTYNLTGLVTNTITPRIISTTAWNWGAKGAFLYLGTCFIVTLWCFFYLPETRRRSFGQIEMLFEARIPARRFNSTVVDQFGSVYAVGRDGEKTDLTTINSRDKSSISDSVAKVSTHSDYTTNDA